MGHRWCTPSRATSLRGKVIHSASKDNEGFYGGAGIWAFGVIGAI